jgi:hypothetical protein
MDMPVSRATSRSLSKPCEEEPELVILRQGLHQHIQERTDLSPGGLIAAASLRRYLVRLHGIAIELNQARNLSNFFPDDARVNILFREVSMLLCYLVKTHLTAVTMD